MLCVIRRCANLDVSAIKNCRNGSSPEPLYTPRCADTATLIHPTVSIPRPPEPPEVSPENFPGGFQPQGIDLSSLVYNPSYAYSAYQ